MNIATEDDGHHRILRHHHSLTFLQYTNIHYSSTMVNDWVVTVTPSASRIGTKLPMYVHWPPPGTLTRVAGISLHLVSVMSAANVVKKNEIQHNYGKNIIP